MSKATTVTLVSDMTLAQSDSTPVSTYYDLVVEDLSRFPWLTTASVVAVASDGSFQLVAPQAKLLEVFWDNRQLGLMSIAEVEQWNRRWREERGEPHSYIVEDEAMKTFRLYPQPSVPNKSLVYPNSEPLGRDFPAYAVVILHTEIRADLPAWLELPVALEVAAREMEKESSHRDVQWAAVARSFADMLFSMVGKA